MGASLQIIVPVGQYNPAKLINLSSNRWTFHPQFGVSHKSGNWIVEAYIGGWFFTRNSNFFGGSLLTQRPLLTSKVHLIRSMSRRGIWLALDVGYGIGGRTTLDGDLKGTRISTFRLGTTLAVPVGSLHSLKFVATSGVRIERGPDFDAFALAYQYRWGGK